MRFATALLLLTICAPLAAQPCDPAVTDEACPDTTDWQRYFPLEVGNRWQYREMIDEDEEVHWGWRITDETEIEGRTYAEGERCDEQTDGTVTCSEPVLLRYDDERPLIVQRTDEGDEWWTELPCRLDLPFGGTPESGFYECDGIPYGEVYLGAEGAYGASVTVPPDVVEGDTRKHIGTPIFTGTTLYAGLGPVEFVDELHPEPTRLVYARVGGEVVGTPAFDFPTAGEGEAAPLAVNEFTAVFPNPVRETVTARYTLGASRAVTLEIVDLLGRVVRTLDVGPQTAGDHEATVEVADLPSGVYVLRMHADEGSVSVRRIAVLR